MLSRPERMLSAFQEKHGDRITHPHNSQFSSVCPLHIKYMELRITLQLCWVRRAIFHIEKEKVSMLKCGNCSVHSPRRRCPVSGPPTAGDNSGCPCGTRLGCAEDAAVARWCDDAVSIELALVSPALSAPNQIKSEQRGCGHAGRLTHILWLLTHARESALKSCAWLDMTSSPRPLLVCVYVTPLRPTGTVLGYYSGSFFCVENSTQNIPSVLESLWSMLRRVNQALSERRSAAVSEE